MEGEEEEREVLVDTGASVSVVTMRLVSERGWELQEVSSTDPQYLIGFMGSEGGKVKVLGCVELEGELRGGTGEGVVVKERFCVADIRREPEILIGWKMLWQNELSLVWRREGYEICMGVRGEVDETREGELGVAECKEQEGEGEAYKGDESSEEGSEEEKEWGVRGDEEDVEPVQVEEWLSWRGVMWRRWRGWW